MFNITDKNNPFPLNNFGIPTYSILWGWPTLILTCLVSCGMVALHDISCPRFICFLLLSFDSGSLNLVPTTPTILILVLNIFNCIYMHMLIVNAFCFKKKEEEK